MFAPDVRRRPVLEGWALIVLFVFSACITSAPRSRVPEERIPLTAESGLESATVYALDFLEPGTVATRPVPMGKDEFKRALQRLAHDIRQARIASRDAHLRLNGAIDVVHQGFLREQAP